MAQQSQRSRNTEPEPPPEPDAAPRRATTTGTATSRAAQVKAAVRKPTKARLALSGVSGSGKTWTALCVAEILAPGGNVLVIDTEPSDDLNTASELYADTFTFNIIDWREPPYDPRDLALTIRELGSLGQTDVLIVDSASAFWRGTGGTLDVAGGNFGGWKTATPAQNDLVAAFLNAPFHVIFCTRAKTEYLVEEGGRKVTKLGLAPIQRDDLEYEFQVVGMIDHEHRIDIGKTRCDDLAGKSFHANGQAELANILKRWLDRGPELIRQYDIDLITDALKLVPRGPERAKAGAEFIAAYGKPDAMPPERLPAAWSWLSAQLDVEPHPFVEDGEQPEEGALPVCGSCGLGARAGWHTSSSQEPPQGPAADPAPPGEGDAPAGAEGATEPGSGDQGVDPPERPSEAAMRAADEEAAAQQALDTDDAVDAAAVAQREADVHAWVGGLKKPAIAVELERRGAPMNGTSAKLGQQLEAIVLDYLAGARKDPMTCGGCGGVMEPCGLYPGATRCDGEHPL